MLFTFFIKDKLAAGIDVMITRGLLTITGIAVLIVRNNGHYFLNLLAAVILFAMAVFASTILLKYKVKKWMLFLSASLLLFIATRSLSFSLVLICYGYLTRFLNKVPTVSISNEGLEINKTFSKPFYQWQAFNNIVLKDSILTIDFKNNRLMQLTIDESGIQVDEKYFNEFCASKLRMYL